jgi:NAD(P)-dependent dehydrogenase (short-subunit alcohol dehydrogenase family)
MESSIVELAAISPKNVLVIGSATQFGGIVVEALAAAHHRLYLAYDNDSQTEHVSDLVKRCVDLGSSFCDSHLSSLATEKECKYVLWWWCEGPMIVDVQVAA